MGKRRSAVPSDIAGRLLFDSDGTCCACRIPGRRVQIHHIDEDPTNHDPHNLAVLCFECHDKTQIKGGFGRTFDSAQVTHYRHDWHRRVIRRRDSADEIASGRSLGLPLHEPVSSPPIPNLTPSNKAAFKNPSRRSLLAYVRDLPAVRKEAYTRARPLKEGSTADQIQAGHDVLDVLTQIMVRLARWYPPNHFGERPVAEYISSLVSDRFAWHLALMEPDGAGTGGTIVGPLTMGAVITDIENMVADMVWCLTLDLSAPVGGGDLKFGVWERRWRRAVYPGLRRETDR